MIPGTCLVGPPRPSLLRVSDATDPLVMAIWSGNIDEAIQKWPCIRVGPGGMTSLLAYCGLSSPSNGGTAQEVAILDGDAMFLIFG
jgi:hypothetical protein